MAVELATAYVSIVPETSKIAPGVRKALGGVEGDADRSGRRMGGKLMGGLATAAKGAAIGAGAAVAAGFGTALVKGFGRLNAIEQAQAKLRGLGHSAETVEGVMTNALNAVKGTAFGMGDAATAAAGMIAAGIKPGKELERTLTLIGDSATIAGADYGQMSAIFGKVAADGRIQGDVINQLNDQGIPILQLLGEQLGVSAGEVRKLASDGKVSFEDFQAAMDAGLGGAAQESGKTFQGALANVGAALGRLGADLLGGVFPKIAPMLQGVIGWLDKMSPVAKAAGAALGDGLSWAGDMIGRLVEQFQSGEGVGGRFRDVIVAINGVVSSVAGWVRDVAVPAFQDFIGQFREGEGAGGSLRDTFERLSAVVGSVAGVFRDTMLPILRDVWAVVQEFILPVLREVVDFIVTKLWPDVVGALESHIVPAFREVGDTVQQVWRDYIEPALRALWGFIRDHLLPLILDLYENGVKPTFKLIGDVIAWTWDKVIKPALFDFLEGAKDTFGWIKDEGWPWLRDALQNMSDKATTFKDNAVDAFNKLKDGVSTVWDGVSTIFGKFEDGLDSLKRKFTTAKDGIKSVWSTIGAAIANPINKVIDAINSFTQSLAEKLSAIPGVSISIGKIPHVPVPAAAPQGGYAGGWRPGYADGGRVAGYSPHARADNIPAWLTAGEYVLPVRATQRLAGRFGPGFLEDLRRGLPGYADGGMVGGSLGDALAGGGRFLYDLFTNPTKALQTIADKALGGIGGSLPAQVALGAVKDTIGKVASWVKDKIFGGVDGGVGGPVGPAMGWQSIWGLVKGLFPDAILTSAVRDSTIAGTNIKSLHASGRAVDFALNPWSRMVEATRVLSSLKRWTELIHTPAGVWQQNRGMNTANFPEITRRMHYDHVHVGMADGGLVKPFVADSGALLRPGLNLLDNRTGGPEPLMRMDQPMRITGRLALDGDGFGRLVDARIEADHDQSRYESRMVGV